MTGRRYAYLLLPLIFASSDGATAPSLFDQLMSIPFNNNGTVHAGDAFVSSLIPSFYLEPEAPPKARYSWADLRHHAYLFASPSPSSCMGSSAVQNGTDRPGSDLRQITSSPSADACGKSCCADPACTAWVFAEKAPITWAGCTGGLSCCYLKAAGVAATPKAGLVSGSAKRDAGASSPPSGMRSAVPLGGIGAGSVELRGDGTLRAWTIVNQSPGGGTKFDTQDDAVFGLFTCTSGSWGGSSTSVHVLRTSPPGVRYKGVSSLTYRGSHPVPRLDISVPLLPVSAERVF